MTAKHIAGAIALTFAILGLLNFAGQLLYWNMGYYYAPVYASVRTFQVRIPFVQYPLDPLFCLGLLVSALVFLLKEQAFKVMAFFSAIIFAQQGTNVLVAVTRFLFGEMRNRAAANGLFSTAITPLVLAAGAWFILRTFDRSWRETTFEERERASKGLRLSGYAIDIMIFVILVNPFPYFDYAYERFLALLILLVFYITFERLFLFTPGKILLDTRVRTTEGAIPDEGSIFKRNLARIIPLEPFSFLGKTGWHDSLSRTSVFRYK